MVEIENWQTLDDKGILMPWLTRPCLAWLDKLDLDGKYVFEYGVGKSTNWLRSRGAICYGVDSDFNWAFDSDAQYCKNQYDYLNAINNCNASEFDIVIIDGDYRDSCTFYAIKKLKKGGLLIIDNWKQATADLPEWPSTESLIKDFECIEYKEPTHQDWQTIVIHV